MTYQIGWHDIDDNEEVGAYNDADHYDGEQSVEDVDKEEVPRTLVARDSHLQELLLENRYGPRGAISRWKSKLEQLEVDSNTPLYDTCHRLEESCLKVALDVLKMKPKHGWTDTSVEDMLEDCIDRIPVGNTCPSSLDEAKRITCPLDLPYKKYHACINDCIMYRNEHTNKTKCPLCDTDRYKKGKKAPRKVVGYFHSSPLATVFRRPQGSRAHEMAHRKKGGRAEW
jgi:hypothetical protein